MIRLADPALRNSLFDADALEQIASAAYGPEAAQLGPPYSAVFSEVQIGVSIPPRAIADAVWGTPGAPRVEGRFVLSGLGRDSPAPLPRVDAIWRGAVVARAAPATGKIVEVQTSWPDPGGIDEEIVAALGSLPTAPAVLETERRTRYLARLRATMEQPAAFTDAIFDRWLAGSGVGSVGNLITRHLGQVATATLQVSWSAPSPPASTPRQLPLTAAVLVRDAPLGLAELLSESKTVREHLVDAGAQRAHSDDLGPSPVLVIWLIPEKVFDDADWPGGNSGTPEARRLARRRAASTWLGAEGIALAPTPAHP